MLGLQVSINLEQQFSVVAVSNPLRQREHADTGLQALGNKVVPQIMVNQPLASGQLASPVQRLLTFKNLADMAGRLRRFSGV